MKRVTTSFTRPDNTTAYTAGDAVNDSASAPSALTWSNVGTPNRIVRVVGLRMTSTNVTATNCALALLLFGGSSAPTPSNDNEAYALAAGDIPNFYGMLTIAATDWQTLGSGHKAVYAAAPHSQGIGVPLGANVPNGLYGLLTAQGAYTPASEEVFTLDLDLLV